MRRRFSSWVGNDLALLWCEQQACGFEYTSKLQRMFQDVGVSKDLNEQFKHHLQNTNVGANDSMLHCRHQLLVVDAILSAVAPVLYSVS